MTREKNLDPLRTPDFHLSFRSRRPTKIFFYKLRCNYVTSILSTLFWVKFQKVTRPADDARITIRLNIKN